MSIQTALVVLIQFYYDIGLDANNCYILEMACIITDKNLNIVAEVR